MNTTANIIRRYTLLGTIKLVSPLVIRAGVYGDILNDTVDDVVVTYSDGQAFISGTSLAGVLRQILWRLEPSYVSLLFGDITDGNYQSALQINDIPLEAVNISVRDGIAIDAVRGVTMDGAKYDFEVIDSGATGQLKIECIVRACYEPQVDDIENILIKLAGLLKQGISIGARTVNGLGKIVCEDIEVQCYDFYSQKAVIAWLLKQSGEIVPIPEVSNLLHDDFIIDMNCYFNDTVLIKSIFSEARENLAMSLFIPGSSIKGVLRHHCRDIIDQMGLSQSVDVKLFGDSKKHVSTKGHFFVDEVYLDYKNQQVEQTRIRVDKFTGGAMNHALFTDCPIRGTKNNKLSFPLHISITDCDDIEAGLMLLLVKDLMTGLITIGANKTIGYGTVEGETVKIRYKNNTYVINNEGKVIIGNPSVLENLVAAMYNSSNLIDCGNSILASEEV